MHGICETPAAGSLRGTAGQASRFPICTPFGRIRIDCENYPEHWQEIQLPEEWVTAYKAYKKRAQDEDDIQNGIIRPKVYTETGELSDKPHGQACRELLGMTDLPEQLPLQDKVEVHADQALTVDEESPGYKQLYRTTVQRALGSFDWGKGQGPLWYDAVQLLVFSAADLEPVPVFERFTDQSFEDIDGVYTALDCGLLGKNFRRKRLHPMLKVYGKEEYIRADSNFKVTFRH